MSCTAGYAYSTVQNISHSETILAKNYCKTYVADGELECVNLYGHVFDLEQANASFPVLCRAADFHFDSYAVTAQEYVRETRVLDAQARFLVVVECYITHVSLDLGERHGECMMVFVLDTGVGGQLDVVLRIEL